MAPPRRRRPPTREYVDDDSRNNVSRVFLTSRLTSEIFFLLLYRCQLMSVVRRYVRCRDAAYRPILYDSAILKSTVPPVIELFTLFRFSKRPLTLFLPLIL
jgi:hypothetical protein